MILRPGFALRMMCAYVTIVTNKFMMLISSLEITIALA
jgi:hypothetical protein